MKSLSDLATDDMRRLYPRFKPEYFEDNMKLVDEVKKIAERKGVTVSVHSKACYHNRCHLIFGSLPKSQLDG